MNDRLAPQNVTSPQIASALPDAWVKKIFSKFEGRYGSLFLDRWRGCDMANVMATWAEELAGFEDQPDRIAYALRSLADQQFPPTLPEFIAACRKAPVQAAGPALTHNPTPEERQRSRESAEAVSRALKAKSSDGIDTHWATHPRGEMHLKFIFDAAKKDQRFRPCVAEMVEDGICTEDGHLLKHYRDRQFYRAGSA